MSRCPLGGHNHDLDNVEFDSQLYLLENFVVRCANCGGTDYSREVLRHEYPIWCIQLDDRTRVRVCEGLVVTLEACLYTLFVGSHYISLLVSRSEMGDIKVKINYWWKCRVSLYGSILRS